MIKKNKFHLIWLCILFLLMTGCGQSHSAKDLKIYIEQLKKKMLVESAQRKPVQLVPPQAVQYQSETKRNPFSPILSSTTESPTGKAESIHAFPLNMIRFVGTVVEGNKTWAIMMTPDDRLYQVTVDDMIGNPPSKVTKVGMDHIEVLEVTIDENQRETQRLVTLKLKG